MKLCGLDRFPGILSCGLHGGSSDPDAHERSGTVLTDTSVLDQHFRPFKLPRELILRKASHSAELKPEFDIPEQIQE